MARLTAAGADAFEHLALFHGDADEYLGGTLSFIRAGLAAGEPVLVAVPPDNLQRIRAVLGEPSGVDLRDMSVAGRNPGRIIPWLLSAFADSHAGQRARIIGEPIWAGRTATEYPACAQHEALINAAFAGWDGTILCPYDTAALDARWLDDAYRTHPVVQRGTARQGSAAYTDPVVVASEFNQSLPEPPAGAATAAVDLAALPHLRGFVADLAADSGLSPVRTADLVLAVNELATNTVQHTDLGGTLTVWTEGRDLVCQVADAGYVSDPLAGRVLVAPDEATHGRGLALVNDVCDLVRVHTGPGATTIRVYMRR